MSTSKADYLARTLATTRFARLRLQGLLSDNWQTLRRDGPRAAIGQLLRVVARMLYHPADENVVLTRSLRDPLPRFEASIPLTIRPASSGDMGLFKAIAPPSDVALFERYLARGRTCYLALHRGEIAGYCWGGTEIDVHLDDLAMKLQPGDVYFFAGYTLPAYRRQGVLAAIYCALFHHFRDAGYGRAVTIVHVENAPSLGLVSKMGYQAVDRLTRQRVLWWRRYLYRAGKF
jgi:ribosomal protein S18 acetylase RimI-like enzyme